MPSKNKKKTSTKPSKPTASASSTAKKAAGTARVGSTVPPSAKSGKPAAAKASTAAAPAKVASVKPAPKSNGVKTPAPKPTAAAPAKPAPTGKPAAKAPAPEVKPVEAAKGKSKAPAAAVPVAVPAAPAKTEAVAAPVVGADGKKVPPKGITVVAPKPMRKPKPKVKLLMPVDPLFKPGAKWKPLIPSGPNATPTGIVGAHANANAGNTGPKVKSKLTKKEMDGYRKILLRKRSELVGDIANMEDEALRQSSGSLSQLPQHMAEQGTDTFEQSLSLDLAAVDRSLIREIDDALKRIDEGTYGMCERTGKPINPERLAELPWARYSIEAARELERRPYQE